MTDSIGVIQRSDHDTLIRLETKLEALTGEIRSGNTAVQTMLADHEARIRNIETIIEVNRGTQTTKTDNRRSMLEVLGLIVSLGLLVVTYVTGHH